MPATDFTLIVAEWLRNKRTDALKELWSLIAYDDASSGVALERSLLVKIPSWLAVDEVADSELRAIYVLGARAALIHFNFATSVLAELVATTLASSSVGIDRRHADQLIDRTEGLQEKEDIRSSIAVAVSSRDEVEAASQKLRGIPPMARLVVYDYFFRGWGGKHLRPHLYYDHRCYGCSGALNSLAIDALGFFGSPPDSAEVPARVTKALLRTALEGAGFQVKKSDTRDQLIGLGRQIPGLIPRLITQVYPENCSVTPSWDPTVKRWAQRVRLLRPLSSEILSEQGMRLLFGSK